MQFDMFSQSDAKRASAQHPALTDLSQMQALLQRWAERRWLRALDVQLPATLHQLAAEPQPLVWLLTALLCHQYGRGHSCILLADLLSDADALLSLPPQNLYLQRFSDRPSAILGKLTLADYQAALAVSPWLTQHSAAPLVLEQNRLYLHRLYQAEQQVKQGIAQRINDILPLPANIGAALEQLFEAPPGATETAAATAPDWQKLACVMALQRRFAIITGGPGTGKTTTVLRLLALLQHAAAQPLSIRLAAPTGKAAVRLTESIRSALNKLPAELSQHIPSEVSTLHRLLGALPNRRSFKHHAQAPLSLDVLVIDEASMVDLEMMAAVLQALPAKAQLILLGDKDQLSSVEAGSVLGDLCRGAAAGGYHSQTMAMLQPYSPMPLTPWAAAEGSLLNQATVMLRHSHRFDAKSGIGQLAQAVNRGDTTAPKLFEQFNDISLLSSNSLAALRPLVVAGYRQYLQRVTQTQAVAEPDVWAKTILQAYSQFQLLCALRSGDWGVAGLNEKISHWLAQENLIQASHLWYSGRPVMLQRNNYSLGLMNGDIGICLTEPQSGKLRVVFQLSDGSLKWVLPSRLSEVETAYAMTVHKSQGSEFAHTVLVLPPEQSPILTRELLYTAITRAKQQFSLLCANMSVLQQAISARVSRSSGL